MKEWNTGAGTNPEDDEIAACIAAIYAYRALAVSQTSPQESTERAPSQWWKQTRLESSGLISTKRERSFPDRVSLWQLSSRCFVAIIVFSILALPVCAQPESGFQPPKQQENSICRLKIGLNLNATTCNITLPDGAELIDKASSELLAELPPQSFWQVALEQNTAGSGARRVAFSGQIGNLGTARVLLAKTPGVYQEAEYSTYEEPSASYPGFKKRPYILEEIYPKFWFGLESTNEQSYSRQAYKPIGFTSADFPPIQSTAYTQSTSYAQPSGYILRPLNPNGVFGLDGKTYRGELLIEPQSNSAKAFSAINLVDLEDYLLSVVPSEMPSSWCLEALKAQAIAARSYAIANLGKHQKDGYDLKASTDDQVYTGVQAESDSTNTAVSETAGLVIKHENKPISAFFHSAAGGYTETAENVWSKELPYLKSVPDFDDQSPHFNWKRSYPLAEVESHLLKSGVDIGGILGLFPLSRAGSKRVKSVLVSGTLRSVVVSGEDMRRIFTLPSTVFNIATVENGYILAGRGFGHGLGLSQWGARYLAENGYNAAQIISYYYKDVSIEPF